MQITKSNIGLALVIAALLVIAGCGKKEAAPSESPAATGSAAPVASSSNSGVTPWSSLSAEQKSVLSVAEDVWTTIPADKQKVFMDGANKWNQMEAADQYKMINEVRDFAKLPHIGPDAARKK